MPTNLCLPQKAQLQTHLSGTHHKTQSKCLYLPADGCQLGSPSKDANQGSSRAGNTSSLQLALESPHSQLRLGATPTTCSWVWEDGEHTGQSSQQRKALSQQGDKWGAFACRHLSALACLGSNSAVPPQRATSSHPPLNSGTSAVSAGSSSRLQKSLSSHGSSLEQSSAEESAKLAQLWLFPVPLISPVFGYPCT